MWLLRWRPAFQRPMRRPGDAPTAPSGCPPTRQVSGDGAARCRPAPGPVGAIMAAGGLPAPITHHPGLRTASMSNQQRCGARPGPVHHPPALCACPSAAHAPRPSLHAVKQNRSVPEQCAGTGGAARPATSVGSAAAAAAVAGTAGAAASAAPLQTASAGGRRRASVTGVMTMTTMTGREQGGHQRRLAVALLQRGGSGCSCAVAGADGGGRLLGMRHSAHGDCSRAAVPGAAATHGCVDAAAPPTLPGCWPLHLIPSVHPAAAAAALTAATAMATGGGIGTMTATMTARRRPGAPCVSAAARGTAAAWVHTLLLEQRVQARCTVQVQWLQSRRLPCVCAAGAP